MPTPFGLPYRPGRYAGLRGRRRASEEDDLLGTTPPTGPRRLRDRLPMPQDYVGNGGAVPPLPVVPYQAERRPMTLNEIGNAEIEGMPRPRFASRLGDALEAAGRQGLFDPGSEDFFEALMGTALPTFAGAREQRRSRDIYEADLRNAIVGQAAEAQRQAHQDFLDEAYTRARIDEIYGLNEPEPPETDVEGLARAYANAGREDLAQFIRDNPHLIEKDPDAWMRGLADIKKSEKEPDLTRVEQGAIRRSEGAEEFAGRQIATMEADVGALEPEERETLAGRLKRQFDPTYQADSTVAARFRPSLPPREPRRRGTVGGIPSTFFRHEGVPDYESVEEILGPSIVTPESPATPPKASPKAAAESTAPLENESPQAYIARLRAMPNMTPEKILALAREHGFVSSD